MSKTTSCGVLLVNERQELLLCHVTGATWWDIPKGGQDPGETPRQTAVREMQEETGIALCAEKLVDLGHFNYRPDKSLYLFAGYVNSDDIRLSDCRSTTHFQHPHNGSMLPEVDDFNWVPFSSVPDLCAKTMGRVLASQISLYETAQDVAQNCCLAKA